MTWPLPSQNCPHSRQVPAVETVNVHGQVVIDGGEHQGLAGGGRLAGLPCQRRDGDARVGEECGVADQDVAALDRGVDAPAGDGGEALGRRQRQAAIAGCGRGLR
jgi:hypothetical protein